jgi:hypothetical protein
MNFLNTSKNGNASFANKIFVQLVCIECKLYAHFSRLPTVNNRLKQFLILFYLTINS